MTSLLFNPTYDEDDDPIYTNIMNSDLTSEDQPFYDLPEDDLAMIASINSPEMLVGFCTFSAHNRTYFYAFLGGPPLTRLPNEVLHGIAEVLPRADLLNLALTSRSLERVCIPVIYGEVDLSIHNRGRVLGVGEPEKYHQQYANSFRCQNVPSQAFTRQEKFLAQVMQHPEYTFYVKSLTWTLLLLREPEWVEEGHEYPLLGKGADNALVDRPILHIWEVFETLRNVRVLDLAYLSHDHGHPLASAFPDALFPRASTIRLSGVFSYALAASILASDPSKITNLTWDNVQTPGARATTNFLYHPITPRQPYHHFTPAPWNSLSYFNHNPTTYFSPAGPMHNLLGSLVYRCPNLTSLTLRKTSERGPAHSQDRSEWTPANATKDEDTYTEFAHFLSSVKGTLKHLVFEQGEHDFHIPSRPRGPPPVTSIVRQMDERFERLIWPVIMFEERDWRFLERVCIFGVQSWGRSRNRSAEVERTLKGKFGTGLLCEVREGADVLEHIGERAREPPRG